MTWGHHFHRKIRVIFKSFQVSFEFFLSFNFHLLDLNLHSLHSGFILFILQHLFPLFLRCFLLLSYLLHFQLIFFFVIFLKPLQRLFREFFVVVFLFLSLLPVSSLHPFDNAYLFSLFYLVLKNIFIILPLLLFLRYFPLRFFLQGLTLLFNKLLFLLFLFINLPFPLFLDLYF